MNRLSRLASSVSVLALLSPAAYAHTPISNAAHPEPSPQSIAHSAAATDINRQRVFNIILKPDAAARATAPAVESYYRRFGFATQYHAYTNRVELHGSYAQAERAGGFRYVAGGALAPYRLSAPPRFPGEFAGAILGTTFAPGPVMLPQFAPSSSNKSTLPTHLGVVGLGPQDYATLYGYNSFYAAGYNGAGQTVDIAACFGYLHGDTKGSNDDITVFASDFGLSPPPNITAFGSGSRATGEPLLDLSRVYGTAPGAAIRIWFTQTCGMADFTNLFLDIADDQSAHPAVALTVSYGLPELLLDTYESANFFTNMDTALSDITGGAAQKVALFAASGDNGDDSVYSSCWVNCYEPTGTTDVLYPASDPNVLAVGGTTVFPVSPSIVTRQAEWAWSGAASGNITGSGGGISNIWPLPSWQKCTGATGACGPQASSYYKNVPDLASVASVESPPLMVYDGTLQETGGTSAASPTLAGTAALLQQQLTAAGHPVTNWPVFFYSNYVQYLNPITGGSNGRYVAQPWTATNPMGYSNVTGLGTPCLSLPGTGAFGCVSSRAGLPPPPP